MKHLEIERRWIVRKIDPQVRARPGTRIRQGYFESPPHRSLRIRVIDGRGAWITRKSAPALAREEEELTIDPDLGRFLLESCPFRIDKTRVEVDGWDVDFFHGPLEGLVVAERELESLEEAVALPSWIEEAAEVTLSVTNSTLARIAVDLEAAPAARRPDDWLPRRVPRIVLTGGPCSGKSTVMDVLRRECGATLHFVPEAATIVIAQVGVFPPAHDPPAMRAFQRYMCRVQRTFENASNGQAVLDGKRALLLDRGVLDNAAYLAGGLAELESILQVPRTLEYAEYDLVLCLDVPPEAVYEAHRRNNPARSESWAAATALGERIAESWSGHARFRRIGNGRGWEDKVAAVRVELAAFLS